VLEPIADLPDGVVGFDAVAGSGGVSAFLDGCRPLPARP
jgi:hypothetical protein